MSEWVVSGMPGDEFRRLFSAWVGGDQNAGNALYSTAYADLKTIAHKSLSAHGRSGHLSTTVLVNECYLKLADGGLLTSNDQDHFYALCARAMRQVIVDAARRALTARKGLEETGGAYEVSQAMSGAPLRPESVTALDQALNVLDAQEPRLVRVAECRIFADMDTPAIARTLGVTERTVQRDWLRIKALLSVVTDSA